MSDGRLLSIAAGVTPELSADPATFVETAAAAGWAGTGIWFDAESWTDKTTTAVRRRLDDTGLVAVDMEVIVIGPDGDVGEACIEAAAEIGAANILTISRLDDPGQTADRFGQLCQLASPAGIRVCLEFMRFTSVRNLSDALDILSQADQPNAGVLMDLLHVERSGTTFEEINAVDPELLPYAQWCDGPTEPQGWENRELIIDALDDRSIPGEGGLRAAEFEQLFAPEVPFSVEVRSKALRDQFADPTERARHLLSRIAAA